MGQNSSIQWTDHTFNPWIGCTKVSPGCANCYAERDWDRRRHVAQWGPAGTRIVTSEENWKTPLRWNKQADATQDDPTIRRCIGFARRWGYDTLSVRNLFPWRATDPKELRVSERTADIFGGNRFMSEMTPSQLNGIPERKTS